MGWGALEDPRRGGTERSPQPSWAEEAPGGARRSGEGRMPGEANVAEKCTNQDQKRPLPCTSNGHTPGNVQTSSWVKSVFFGYPFLIQGSPYRGHPTLSTQPSAGPCEVRVRVTGQ